MATLGGVGVTSGTPRGCWGDYWPPLRMLVHYWGDEWHPQRGVGVAHRGADAAEPKGRRDDCSDW